jgi:hypothetical protein
MKQQVIDDLKKMVGFASPHAKTVDWTAANGAEVSVDFSAVDSMSCCFEELRLCVPTLVNADAATLEQWAADLCQRITYLLEQIGPLEVDSASGSVLVRSTSPDKQPDGTRFYEILLHSHTNGNFSLRRYHAVIGNPGRSQVPITTTHEVFQKLVVDLVETVPTP